MKSLDKVIDDLTYLSVGNVGEVLYYLKEYREQKKIIRKLIRMLTKMIWGVDYDEYPLDNLDSKYIQKILWEVYRDWE